MGADNVHGIACTLTDSSRISVHGKDDRIEGNTLGAISAKLNTAISLTGVERSVVLGNTINAERRVRRTSRGTAAASPTSVQAATGSRAGCSRSSTTSISTIWYLEGGGGERWKERRRGRRFLLAVSRHGWPVRGVHLVRDKPGGRRLEPRARRLPPGPRGPGHPVGARFRLVAPEAVSHARFGPDIPGLGGVRLDLVAQPSDVHAEGAG